jgi:4'-phosphopantetheinyl transferase
VNQSASPAGRASTLDVWRVRHADGAQAPASARSLLSPAELERAGRYHRDVHRQRFLAVHAALREILGAALGVAPCAVAYEIGPHGKPRLAGAGGLHFNLSDTEGCALIALSTHGPLGVDVERHRGDRSLADVAERFFSEAEVRALRALEPGQRTAGFYRVWTRKEAYVKALGAGLSLGLSTFDVSIDPGPGARLLATRPDPAEAGRWRLFDLDVGPEHSAALVVHAAPSTAAARLVVRDWSGAREPAR